MSFSSLPPMHPSSTGHQQSGIRKDSFLSNVPYVTGRHGSIGSASMDSSLTSRGDEISPPTGRNYQQQSQQSGGGVGGSLPRKSTKSWLKERNQSTGNLQKKQSTIDKDVLSRTTSNTGVLLAKNSIVKRMDKNEEGMLSRIGKCKVDTTLALRQDANMTVFDTATTSHDLHQEMVLLQEVAMVAQQRQQELERQQKLAAQQQKEMSSLFSGVSPLSESNLAIQQSLHSNHSREGSPLSPNSAANRQKLPAKALRKGMDMDTILASSPTKKDTSMDNGGGDGDSPMSGAARKGSILPGIRSFAGDRNKDNRGPQGKVSNVKASVRALGFDPDALEEYTKTLRPAIHRSTLNKEDIDRKVAAEVDKMRSESIMMRKRRAKAEQQLQQQKSLGMLSDINVGNQLNLSHVPSGVTPLVPLKMTQTVGNSASFGGGGGITRGGVVVGGGFASNLNNQQGILYPSSSASPSPQIAQRASFGADIQSQPSVSQIPHQQNNRSFSGDGLGLSASPHGSLHTTPARDGRRTTSVISPTVPTFEPGSATPPLGFSPSALIRPPPALLQQTSAVGSGALQKGGVSFSGFLGEKDGEMPDLWSFEHDEIKKKARADARKSVVGGSSSSGGGGLFSMSHDDDTATETSSVGDGQRAGRPSLFMLGGVDSKPKIASDELSRLNAKLQNLESCGLLENSDAALAQAEEARNSYAKKAKVVDGDADSDRVGKEFKSHATAKGLRLVRASRWCPFQSTSVQPEPWVKNEPTWYALESETNIPAQDLHLYQMYCANKNMVIMLRPVSYAVPDLYAGTFFLESKYCDNLGAPLPQPNLSPSEIKTATRHECRVKGKSINVSLKSSSYAPIDGLIPVNPALGKAYLDAQRREREIEDMILNAQGGVLTITLLRKLKAQKAQAGSLTMAFVRDIEKALRDSTENCDKLMEAYKKDVVLTVDKAAISRKYLDQFNEAQFLGTTKAKWRGFEVFYVENNQGVVVRNEHDVPIFHIKKGEDFFEYNQESKDVELEPTKDTACLKPVLVVTHRTFYMSPTTQRLEEEKEAYLIGPDFDGLAYGSQQDPTWRLHQYKEWAEMNSKPVLSKSMGLVTPADVEHIIEMRALTEWKQNHGYESGNTVKSQPLGKGTYVVITPKTVKILEEYSEIVGFYRNAWLEGIPLLLNPNWKVVIDRQGLPCPYGEDLHIPIIDDCGYAAIMSRIDHEGDNTVTYPQLKERYTSLESRYEKAKSEKKLFTSSTSATDQKDLFTEMCEVEDKKVLAQLFYQVRRWQLMPPWRRLVRKNRSRGASRGNDGIPGASFRVPQAASFRIKRGAGLRNLSESRRESGSTMNKSQGEDGNSRPTSPPDGAFSRSRSGSDDDYEVPPPNTHFNELGEEVFWSLNFEEFRKEKVQHFKKIFDQHGKYFDRLHPKSPFLALLKEFITPEEEPLDVVGSEFLVKEKSLAASSPMSPSGTMGDASLSPNAGDQSKRASVVASDGQ